ncbi:mechanosensitive ion channel family protein, partial [Bacillus sp. SS-TM]
MDLLAKWFNSMKQYLLDADRWAHIGVAILKICIILTIGAVVVRIA